MLHEPVDLVGRDGGAVDAARHLRWGELASKMPIAWEPLRWLATRPQASS